MSNTPNSQEGKEYRRTTMSCVWTNHRRRLMSKELSAEEQLDKLMDDHNVYFAKVVGKTMHLYDSELRQRFKDALKARDKAMLEAVIGEDTQEDENGDSLIQAQKVGYNNRGFEC